MSEVTRDEFERLADAVRTLAFGMQASSDNPGFRGRQREAARRAMNLCAVSDGTINPGDTVQVVSPHSLKMGQRGVVHVVDESAVQLRIDGDEWLWTEPRDSVSVVSRAEDEKPKTLADVEPFVLCESAHGFIWKDTIDRVYHVCSTGNMPTIVRKAPPERRTIRRVLGPVRVEVGDE